MAFHYMRGQNIPGSGRFLDAFDEFKKFGDTLLDYIIAPVAELDVERKVLNPSVETELSVGIGGDIPVYPPLLVVLLMLLALMLHRKLGARRFLPGPLGLFIIRSGFALGVCAWCDKTRREVAYFSMQAGATTNSFGPVRALVTDGPYAQSRNPYYFAMSAVLPAMAIFCDSSWVLMVAPVLPAYLHGIVVPAEERLLRRSFGVAYTWYAKKTPKWASLF